MAATFWKIHTVLLVTALCGCATVNEQKNPIRFSLETLGSDYASRGDTQGNQNRTAVNITGLSLPISAGETVTTPGGDLPDLLAIPISADCSKYTVTKFDTDAEYSDVLSLKSNFDELTEQALDVSVADIKLLLISIGLDRAKGKTAQEVSGDANLTMIEKMVGAASPDNDGFSAAQAAILAEKVSAQQQMRSLLKEIRGLGSKKNIVVARWAGSQNAGGGLSVGSIISGDASSSTKQSGYVILAGIRDTSLLLGKDFTTRLKVEKKQFESGKSPNDIETLWGDPYIVLFTRAAKYVVYSEQVDLSAALSAKLQLSPDQLKAIAGGGVMALLKQQELTLNYTFGIALAAANQGGLSEPKREEYEYRFWAREVRSKAIEEEQKRLQGYSIVYHNRANVIRARNAIRDSVATVDECMHVVPKNGSLESVGAENLGTEFCLPDKQLSDPDHSDWTRWKPKASRCIDLGRDILAH
jgi:hypothetical protein